MALHYFAFALLHDSRGIEIVNFTISLALSAGRLMASAGTPYRLVPAHFYPCIHLLKFSSAFQPTLPLSNPEVVNTSLVLWFFHQWMWYIWAGKIHVQFLSGTVLIYIHLNRKHHNRHQHTGMWGMVKDVSTQCNCVLYKHTAHHSMPCIIHITPATSENQPVRKIWKFTAETHNYTSLKPRLQFNCIYAVCTYYWKTYT